MSGLFLIQSLLIVGLLVLFVLYRKGHFSKFKRAGFEERSVSFSRGQMSYLEAGDGRSTVLVLHGFADAKEQWADFANELTKSGFRVVVPDLPGFGGSFGDVKFEATTLASAVRSFVQAAEVDVFHLVGHSTGALVAAAYAYGYPVEVSSLTLIEPFGIRVPYESELDKALSGGRNPLVLSAPSAYDSLLRFVTARPPEMRRSEKEDRARAMVENRAAYQEAWQEMREGKRVHLLDLLLPEIQVRTMAVFGAKSRVVHPKTAEAVTNLDEDIETEVLPGVGHWPMVEQPERLAASLVPFFRKR